MRKALEELVAKWPHEKDTTDQYKPYAELPCRPECQRCQVEALLRDLLFIASGLHSFYGRQACAGSRGGTQWQKKRELKKSMPTTRGNVRTVDNRR